MRANLSPSLPLPLSLALERVSRVPSEHVLSAGLGVHAGLHCTSIRIGTHHAVLTRQVVRRMDWAVWAVQYLAGQER